MGNNNIGLLDELKALYDIKTNKMLSERFDIPIKTIDTWIFNGYIPKRGLSIQYINLLIEIAKREKEILKNFEEIHKLMSINKNEE